MKKIELTEEKAEWPDTDEWATEKDQDMFIDLAFHYARYVLAPPILADRLRRLGDDRASPRDFECECPVLAQTSRPYCLFARRNCRFAGNGAASAEDAEKMIRDNASLNASGKPGETLKRMILHSVNQTLAYDLMSKISRKYLDASARGRAEIISEMERGIERASRRNKCKADR